MKTYPTRLVHVQCNATGRPVGESHPNARKSDAVVEQARAMYAEGVSLKRIGEALGISWNTIWQWVSGRRRNAPAVRVIARRQRVKDQ